jgi:hypothetical protein
VLRPVEPPAPAVPTPPVEALLMLDEPPPELPLLVLPPCFEADVPVLAPPLFESCPPPALPLATEKLVPSLPPVEFDEVSEVHAPLDANRTKSGQKEVRMILECIAYLWPG